MADDSPKGVVNGVLGHLPPLPRRALSNSFLAMEQASRKREGLPLLTDADIEALKAGRPMDWESGDVASAAASTAPAPAPLVATAMPAAPASPAPAASTSAPTAVISEEVAKWVAAGKKWSKSAIAAEQAGRARKSLPALNDAEITALLGEPATPAATAPPTPAATAPAAPAAATAASVPRPAAAAAATVTASAAASVARSGEATKYVGTPAVGTSKAVAGAGVASVGPEDNEINLRRMEMQEHVGKHTESPIARCVVMLVAEDRLVDFGLGWLLEPLDLFLGLGGHIGLEGLNVLVQG